MDEEQINKESQKESRPDYDELKISINTFLWSHMPGKATLDEMEAIACVIWDKITNAWEIPR